MLKTYARDARLLLISNSTLFGGGYLDHAEEAIRAFLDGVKRVLFVPYALFDRDGYAQMAQARFGSFGITLDSTHRAPDACRAVEDADAVFVGGGNTFRLLKALHDQALLEPIRRRVSRGMPYVGSSAGSIVSGPTIKTTKDMPIVQPPSFDAFDLVPFQISPHYLDPDPSSTHMGETQEERIGQFLEENATPVVGLREGTLLRVGPGQVLLEGIAPARVFRRAEAPVEVEPGANLYELVFPGTEAP